MSQNRRPRPARPTSALLLAVDGQVSLNCPFPQAALLAAAACLLALSLLPIAAEAVANEEPVAASAAHECAAAQDESTASEPKKREPIPPGPKRYMGREIAQTMHYLGAPWLVRESREREEECSTLLAALKIKPGQTICDMGCGNGFYTLELAKLVGEQGKVYAVDIQQEMLRMLDERAKADGIENIKPVLGTVVDPDLPQGKLDLILCVDVYHEFSHPRQMLEAMKKSLAPGGRLVLVEFRAEDPTVPIKPLHKMTKKQISKELTHNGFKLVEEFDKLPWQHVMFFEAGPKE